ncbi:hypothetical protein MCOR02_007673 [Pyricularia oryzae]|nr:hypothetical protein MCOR02_007673 [Pyricularia oryzae]
MQPTTQEGVSGMQLLAMVAKRLLVPAAPVAGRTGRVGATVQNASDPGGLNAGKAGRDTLLRRGVLLVVGISLEHVRAGGATNILRPQLAKEAHPRWQRTDLLQEFWGYWRGQ